MNFDYKNLKYKLKDLKDIDFDENVLVSKRLLYFALYSIQDAILLEKRHNHCPITGEFSDKEIQEFLSKVEKLACPDGYYQLMELINGEKFDD